MHPILHASTLKILSGASVRLLLPQSIRTPHNYAQVLALLLVIRAQPTTWISCPTIWPSAHKFQSEASLVRTLCAQQPALHPAPHNLHMLADAPLIRGVLEQANVVQLTARKFCPQPHIIFLPGWPACTRGCVSVWIPANLCTLHTPAYTATSLDVRRSI